MKKSLLALAVLGAFAGAASAQSSVTIYGRLDMGLQKANESAGASTLAGAPGTKELQLKEASGSRLGFRGTEDLGGGLKANFAFEHRFTADDGKPNASLPFWGAQSWVGLSGGFGEVRLGRDYAPAFHVAAGADPFGWDTVGQAGALHTMAGVGTPRVDNQISYKSPSLGGLTVMLGVAPKEAAGGKNVFGANAVYAAGPLSLGAAYQNAGSQTTVAGSVKTSLLVLSAGYDFGVVRPVVLFAKGSAESAAGADVADNTNLQLAVTAPLGGGLVKGVVARLKSDLGSEPSTVKFGLGYDYPLSKRTKVYADVGTAKQSDPDLKRRTAFDVGIQHNF